MRNRILFLMIFSLLFPLGMSVQTINAEIEILGGGNIDSYGRTSAYQSHKVYLNTTSSVKADVNHLTILTNLTILMTCC